MDAANLPGREDCEGAFKLDFLAACLWWRQPGALVGGLHAACIVARFSFSSATHTHTHRSSHGHQRPLASNCFDDDDIGESVTLPNIITEKALQMHVHGHSHIGITTPPTIDVP